MPKITESAWTRDESLSFPAQRKRHSTLARSDRTR
jgi:hypothetical protein